MDDDELIRLGGNIELSGFREVDGGSMLILRKIIGNYVRKLTDRSDGFEKLVLTMKPVHEIEGSKKFELQGRVIENGKTYSSEVTDHNLFVAVDTTLKKIESALGSL